MNPLVSVIIPCYKAAFYIEETLRSVIEQTYSPIEIIVVDDGSPDNQADLIKAFCIQHPTVLYIFQENSGVSNARNNGYRHAKGEYLAFLDADDVWLPRNIELKVDKLTKNDFGLVHSAATFIDSYSNQCPGGLEGAEGWLLDRILNWEGTAVPGPSSILVKKEVVENIGGFDPKLSTSADLDFFIRVASKFQIGKLEEITWLYRIHPENMHKNIPLMEKDMLLVYQNINTLSLFKTNRIKKNSYAKLYLVLGLCFIGDQKNYSKGLEYILKSIAKTPAILLKYIKERYSK
jgi:glycosyltransferase involved in cell wall biosynthesis